MISTKVQSKQYFKKYSWVHRTNKQYALLFANVVPEQLP